MDFDNRQTSEWRINQTPRTWQGIALDRWKKEGNRGVVSIVTGGGKTVFAQMCMLAYALENEQPRFNIIVPTNALLDQWYVSLLEDLNVQESEIACFSGEEKPDEPRRINLFVINTAREYAPEIASRNENNFLIVDECHRAGSPQNALALRGAYTATLGLSATPEREYDEGFTLVIKPVLGKVIYEYGYKEAAKDGVITEFRLINVRTDFQKEEQKKYNQLTRKAAILFRKLPRDPDAENKLKVVLRNRATVSNSAKMRLPVAAKLVLANRGARTLVFHEQVAGAESLVKLLRQKQMSVTIYHSKISPIIRRDNLRLFRRGMFDVLVSCRALDEGLNVPEASVAIIASSTASLRQRIQRLGRVLRPSTKKTEALIYTIFVSDQELKRLEKEANELEGAASIAWMQAGIQ